MSRDDNAPQVEAHGVLRTQGMNQVLPRHDLDLVTLSRNYPEGDWVLSELPRRHQFQAAYYVPDPQGQLVPAPMPPVNVSAVTNEEEIFQHCTVYQFAAAYQSRGDTDHLEAVHAIGQNPQDRGRGLPSGRGNHYQQVPLAAPAAEQYHSDPDRKYTFDSNTEPAFFASPPPYSAAANVDTRAFPPDKDARISAAQIHGGNFVRFSGESIVTDYSSHQDSSMASASFVSKPGNDSFRQNPAHGDMHGLGTLSPQDVTTDLHGLAIPSNDLFNIEFSPAMMTQLDDYVLDGLFEQDDDTCPDASGLRRNQTDDDDAHGGDNTVEAPK
ncbi:hypothetical protein CMUS01_06574 [Colletotrichum musicola]|uniref:Uncharacterized protein n=1 Tax=Colletotrichum musicola TaxID=2175873 RepID=A0A8H6KMG2_9PEZI|nr:hypothetical protein CMUS01_06574 [Colletotrichum musicola]